MKAANSIIVMIVIFVFVIFPVTAFSGQIILINETDPACELKGVWAPHGQFSSQGCIGGDYHYTSRHAPYAKTGKEKAVFTPDFPADGKYKVEVAWRGTENRSSKVDYEVVHKNGKTSITLSQRADGHTWATLGIFEFKAGKSGSAALVSDGGGSASIDAARFTLVTQDGARPENNGTSSIKDLLKAAGGKNSPERGGGEETVIILDAASRGVKTYTVDGARTVYVTPYLETYGPARLSVKIKKAGGKEIEWMKWERRNDKDPSPLYVNGKAVPASMKNDAGDFSPSAAAACEYHAEKGDTFVLNLEGKFGKARPRLTMRVK
jgi:hypothetical protein